MKLLKVRLARRIWLSFAAWNKYLIQINTKEYKRHDPTKGLLQNDMCYLSLLQNALEPFSKAKFLQLVWDVRGPMHVVIEQPSSSWAYRQPYMKKISELLQMLRGCRRFT